MIKEELHNFTARSIELIAKCAVESFNSNYNLDLEVNQIFENFSHNQNNTKEVQNNEKTKEHDINEDEITILMDNLCIGLKKDGTKCNKKIPENRIFCGRHNSLGCTIPLTDYVDIIAKEKNYEIKPKIISIGNHWAEDTKMDKWPQIITTTTNPFRGYIMFFTDYDYYLGAGVFIFQYNSPLKKKNHCIATHYVEVNNYCESLGGNIYIKVNFSPIEKIKDKPVFERITDLLNPYGIAYDLTQITKGKKDYSDSNPIVTSNKINDILYKHNNVMYFNKDSYLKFCACKTREGENHFAWGRCGVDPEALCMLRKRLNNQDRNWSIKRNLVSYLYGSVKPIDLYAFPL
ncbi:hypothetical protein BCR32DRAFT_292378 [Anaeromyces robustus]|uniref:Uncharacterized protein n=1 Tax=Anaeromyces robustus TaxID=1754192 RepID=A0A1Y1XAR2_9FUNG|nr:hypothetical protein BCR32DRAFT_292378 [Anaeromyces robustus]|eukprot:ORX82819.1 hypothetical protein BCR32DRAFT_292378 [Anaeromyces robustus]